MNELPDLLQKHLYPPNPLELSFNIEEFSGSNFHDMLVELPDTRVKSFTGIPAPVIKEIHFLDAKVQI